MALRATTPEPIAKRLKLFLFGLAGTGKTLSSLSFPNAYIIDAEKGTENYAVEIIANKSKVYHTTRMEDVIAEVRSLHSEKHNFHTLIIDPITTIWSELLDKYEEKIGSASGRQYGAAGKDMKRLANLLIALDMNIIMCAHGKNEYGAKMEKIGTTFDAWRGSDYLFDLVIELKKDKNRKRWGEVVKTRIKAFEDQERFPWSYEEFQRRYDVKILERDAGSTDLASADQIKEICELLNIVRLPDGTVDKWFAKAEVDCWDDMPADIVGKCIDHVRGMMQKGGVK